MQIAVLNTGGTISCVGTPLAPMSAEQFKTACQTYLDPIIAQSYPDVTLTYVTDLSFPESSSGTLDSTNLQPTDWCLLASYLLGIYSTYDAFIVLHGTDTMDFTGTALPFLLSAFDANGIATAVISKPIILTGSQLPMFYQGPQQTAPSGLLYNTDAFQNVCGAVAAAQTGTPEVCVYFHGSLFRGNRAVKTNANQFAAFSSPNYPALAECGITFDMVPDTILPGPVTPAVSLDTPAVVAQVQAQLTAITAAINSVPVMQFNAVPAWYQTTPSAQAMLAKLITACVGEGIKGLVLESYGEGNFPSGNPNQPTQGAIYQALDSANAAGVVIVDCTQVLQGTVNNSAYAAGAWLPEVGALSPADMTPMAALAKLMILLAAQQHNGWSLATVKTLLQSSLLGEMTSVNRLDSRVNDVLLPGQSISALDGSATLINDAVLGPRLLSSTGTVLWSALGASTPADPLPGRLVMQNDGNLVLYSRNTVPLWATNTGIYGGASSVLTLSGSMSNSTLTLQVYDYQHRKVTATLYSQS